MDAYSKIPRYNGMKNITTEEVMYKLDLYKTRFGKVDELIWWDINIIQNDTWKKFTFKEFQECLSVRGVWLALAAPENQKMNIQVGVTWKISRTIA